MTKGPSKCSFLCLLGNVKLSRCAIALWSVHITYSKRILALESRDDEGPHGEVFVGVHDALPDHLVVGGGVEGPPAAVMRPVQHVVVTCKCHSPR